LEAVLASKKKEEEAAAASLALEKMNSEEAEKFK